MRKDFDPMKEETFAIPNDWTFNNQGVANAFDRHVRESLPWYDLVAGAVAHYARHYLPPSGRIYDIGASTGNIGKLLDESLTARNAELISIESSGEMAELFQAQGKLEIADATSYDYKPFDVATLFLVLMFMTMEQRQTLLEKLIDKCRIGGAIIIVDKMETTSNYIGTINRRLTLAGKVATNCDANDIIAKELSLAGIQRPLRRIELPANSEPFFQFGEFVGFIVEITER
jgi:tRNA (cmo5U34)-methyltransferase